MPDLITVSWCRERGACLDDDELRELLGDGLTARKVLDLDTLAADRVWAVSQWLPKRERRAFLADLLARLFGRERAAGREPDPRSVAVLEALCADRWPTAKERSAAKAAMRARATWGAAAWAAARSATWATKAAEEAAEASAAAARSAAWAAKTEEAEAEAGADERLAQLACLRRLMERVSDGEDG